VRYLFSLRRLQDQAAHSIIVLNGIDACVHGMTLRRRWDEGFCISDSAP